MQKDGGAGAASDIEQPAADARARFLTDWVCWA
jgi:hypothetical protein